MSEDHPIRVGIAGLGRTGWRKHLPNYESRSELFNIVAACDVDEQRAAAAASRVGCKTYTKVEDLIADPEVELIDIATRSCDHHSQAIAALEAGKSVMVEKPMALTYKQAMAMADVSRRTGSPLLVYHNRRFDAPFCHVREVISSGILGEVFDIEMRCHSYVRRDDWQTLMRYGGGQLLNWGPHLIDQALRLLDSPVTDTWSDLKRVVSLGDTEDSFRIMLRGNNRRVIDVRMSAGAAIDEPLFTVLGTRGGLTCNKKQINLRYLDPSTPLPSRTIHEETPEWYGGYASPDDLKWICETIDVNPTPGLFKLDIWNCLYETIKHGKTFPIALDEAVEVMRIMDLVKKGTEFERTDCANQ
ncbi:MAG: Gfo/Idh/MocA family oxidoreductase [Armatimonadota bacterium]|nr:Gfo/Idh/MocA family oxidoreductase [bacterium]